MNQQLKILTDFLTTEKSLVFIVFHVAVVPAFCEELLFRGFIFRLYSNSAGWIWGILISGALFGLYHFKLTQVIPLALIGMFFAWLTLRSGSLLPAIVAHFVNNAGSVIVAFLYPEFALASPEDMLPEWWMLFISVIISGVIVYLIHQIAEKTEKRLLH
jgi:membrane protease YdiL (CAAX protease family)